jgi:integrase
MEVLIPRSKTDQSGEGQICAIPYGDVPLCPVSALIKWRDISNYNTGFVFRAISKHQQISEAPLTTDGINLIIKSIAIKCQLPQAEKISGHSLRRGFATCASRQGATFVSIMRHGRWRHERTVLGYIEEGQRFEENAATVLLGKKKSESVET